MFLNVANVGKLEKCTKMGASFTFDLFLFIYSSALLLKEYPKHQLSKTQAIFISLIFAIDSDIIPIGLGGKNCSP